MAVVSNDGIYMYNSGDVSMADDSMANYFSLLSNVANQNNQWSAEQAMKQMEFQERMSNTAHQREMDDLKASGLNPILSAKSGATSPSGAMGQFDSGITNAFGEIITKLLDIQNDNAKAQLLSSAIGVKNGSYGFSYGTGDYGNSGNIISENKDLLMLTIEGITGMSPTNAGKIVDQASRVYDKYEDSISGVGAYLADKGNQLLSYLGIGSNTAKNNSSVGYSSEPWTFDSKGNLITSSGSSSNNKSLSDYSKGLNSGNSKDNPKLTPQGNAVVNAVKAAANTAKNVGAAVVSGVKSAASAVGNFFSKLGKGR